MLYHRYADPKKILSTYDIAGAFDLVLYLLEQERDEQLFRIWLQAGSEKGFDEFKWQRGVRPFRKRQAKVLTREQEVAQLNKAYQIIKPRK